MTHFARLFLLALSFLHSQTSWSSSAVDTLTYNVGGTTITVEVQVSTGGKTVFSIYAPEAAITKGEAGYSAHPRADGLVPLIDIEFEQKVENTGRRVTLPSPVSQTLDRYTTDRPYSFDTANSARLASASLPQGLLAFSVPENATTERLVLMNISALLKNPRTPAQEVMLARQTENTMRFYSLRSIDVDARWGNGGKQQATLISVADVDSTTGAFRTTGAGVFIHQLYFNIDRAFHDFNEIKEPLRVQRSIQSGIVRLGPTGEPEGKMVYQVGKPHAVPHFLPEMREASGRIDPSVLVRGSIHPSIIATVSKQGADGILALPYLPLSSRDPKVLNDLFEKFDSQYKAELTIREAEATPRDSLRNTNSVNQIVEAILAKSDVSGENAKTRQARRSTQERGLRLLARIGSDYPYALEALSAIAASEKADSTLKRMATQEVKNLPGDLRGKQKSQKAAQELIETISASVRCGASFQAIR